LPRFQYDADGVDDDTFPAHGGTRRRRPRQPRRERDVYIDPREASGATLSTYADAVHGPEPIPAWVITSGDALDVERGPIKTGKEADVHLIERRDPDDGRAVLLAAKRYREADHRLFHRDVGYLEGRRTRKTRETRAMATRTDFGRQVIAQQWAATEFDTLGRLWSMGIAVPYPVQLADREVLLEFIGSVDGTPAPRLAEAALTDHELTAMWDQCVDAVLALGALGFTHGDLSPYNILVDDGRVVLIDLPQVVDLVVNPQGLDYLARDCTNLCTWFGRRRVATVEPERLASWVLEARP
jgi:RIO kinase 1